MDRRLLLALVVIIAFAVSPEVVVSQETTTTTPSQIINITLPRIYPYTINRIDVLIHIEIGSLTISLIGLYSEDPTVELYPVNIRVYDNKTNGLIASIYYDPMEQCFEANPPSTYIPGISGMSGIHYGRWVVGFDGEVARVEIYRVIEEGGVAWLSQIDVSGGGFGKTGGLVGGYCDLSGMASCPGDPVSNIVLEECNYELLHAEYVVMPKLYQFPEAIKPLFDSFFMMLIIGMFVAFMLRGDIKTIAIGMVVIGGLVIPFLYLLSINVTNAPLISILLVVAGIIILWLNK